jgi:hypothetical protein
MKLIKVNYNKLNSKQKENYNFHKVAAALAEYGYNSMRLNDDWQGADFIAVNGDEMLKIQLKGRFTISHKYKNKDIYVAFIENGNVKLYHHDDAYSLVKEHTKKTKSWKMKIGGGHSWRKTPEYFKSILINLD